MIQTMNRPGVKLERMTVIWRNGKASQMVVWSKVALSLVLKYFQETHECSPASLSGLFRFGIQGKALPFLLESLDEG